MKFIKKRIFVKSSSHISLLHLRPEANQDRYSKVISTFLELIKNELENQEYETLSKDEFMNLSMLMYSTHKKEVDVLVKTYENLSNYCYQPMKNVNNVGIKSLKIYRIINHQETHFMREVVIK